MKFKGSAWAAMMRIACTAVSRIDSANEPVAMESLRDSIDNRVPPTARKVGFSSTSILEEREKRFPSPGGTVPAAFGLVHLSLGRDAAFRLEDQR
jgi:hypothetical protein